MSTALEITFPEKLQPLFQPKRYKVLWGGRGGAKSWGIARALLILGYQRPLRILCARQQQNSIADSVHKLLKDQIYAMGLESFYEIQRDVIRGQNGTEFFFEGIHRNVTRIKSYEGIDICWVEEAVNVTENSWQILIPTIRKPDSEFWLSFNPELESDYTYKRFVKDPPEDSVVIFMSWRDNKWFPQVLRNEMEELRTRDYDAYLNIWEGQCRTVLSGAVYANELRAAASPPSRITRVPYDPTIGVSTFWDLGWADQTTIWFAQAIGFEYRLIDYYSGSMLPIDHYVQVCEGRGYSLDTFWLPHDAKAKQLGSGKSIEEIIRAKGKKVRIVPRLSLIDGINAARTVFPQCYFDESSCVDGIRALRSYRFEIVQDTRDGAETLSKAPVHDWCVVGETKVLTRYGTYCMQDLPPTGKVLTPCGWKQYENPRITQKNAPLVAVSFSDGLTMRCTPEHMFLTDSGWKFAKDLQKNMLIQSCSIRSRSFSMAISIAFTLVTDTLLKVARDSIAKRGQRLLEKFLQTAIFTIWTATAPIMRYGTLSAYQSLNISLLHGRNIELTTAALRMMQEQKRRTGTGPTKEGSGTADKLSALKAGQNGREKLTGVFGVVRNFKSWYGRVLLHKNTVVKTAKWLTIDTVSEQSPADVWCITVPGYECFTLENGAVVHNSSHGADAFRYFAVAMKQPRREGPVGKIKQAAEDLGEWAWARSGPGSGGSGAGLNWMGR